MVRILQNKKLATSFQILVEIATHQPNIQQKLIAPRIGVTPQAVSEYIAQLAGQGLVEALGRSRYRVTREGVNWILDMARELEDYCALVGQAVTRLSVSAAVAEVDLTAGQEVGLSMREGCLYAGPDTTATARGVTIAAARAGEDVGIADFQGIVDLEPGTVSIGRVPAIENGGSSRVNTTRLQKAAAAAAVSAAIGVEAICAMRRAGLEPTYRHGAAAATAEAARSGLNSLVVCAEDGVMTLAQRLESEGLKYRIIDLGTTRRSQPRR